MIRCGRALQILAPAFLGLGGHRLAAQGESDSSDLAAVEAMVGEGRVTEAQVRLNSWFEASSADAPHAEIAHARLLRARLSPDPERARDDYLWVAIDGRTPHGAAAWLRLAQMDLVLDEPARAKDELERLRSNFPASRLDGESWYWSGVALERLGDVDAACDAWEISLVSVGNPAGLEGLTRDALAGCGGARLRFTVQVGAFRERATAERVMSELRDEGLDARIEVDGGLHKVRVGRFSSASSARGMAERLSASGRSAVVVGAES